MLTISATEWKVRVIDIDCKISVPSANNRRRRLCRTAVPLAAVFVPELRIVDGGEEEATDFQVVDGGEGGEADDGGGGRIAGRRVVSQPGIAQLQWDVADVEGAGEWKWVQQTFPSVRDLPANIVIDSSPTLFMMIA